ncbi:MAG: hypothetical protein ACP5O7_13110 [Phycisphaerae bacterium]
MLQALHRRIKKDLVCFICGKPGHRSPQCPDKDNIPRNQWAIKKAMAGMQSKGKEDADDDMSQISRDDSIKTSTSNRSVHHKKTVKGWSGLTVTTAVQECGSMHKQIDQKKCKACIKDLSDVILLDSGSSIGATFMNPDLVTGIKVAKHPLILTTNAGSKVLGLRRSCEWFWKGLL